MTKNFISQLSLLIALAFTTSFMVGCKADVDGKKQQKAFHVDANDNLLNKKGEIVKKKGEYKMEGGYYVDNNGDAIKRNIDKTKEKINSKVGETKGKIKNAASKSKRALKLAKDRTKESVTASFNELFNTKAAGTIYPLSEIKFDKTSHKIVGMNKADVEGMATSLKANPGSRIQVQVYTADAKTRSENKKISGLRAQVVQKMLIALGVKEDQISAKGMGLPTEDAAKAVANAVEVVVEQ